DLVQRGDFQRMASSHRDSLIEAAANLIVRLQRARISWRSMKAKHFYPEDLGDGRWRIWLIDWGGVYRWPTRGDCERQWQKYLGSFRSDAPGLHEAFHAAYRLASAA